MNWEVKWMSMSLSKKKLLILFLNAHRKKVTGVNQLQTSKIISMAAFMKKGLIEEMASFTSFAPTLD